MQVSLQPTDLGSCEEEDLLEVVKEQAGDMKAHIGQITREERSKMMAPLCELAQEASGDTSSGSGAPLVATSV